MSGSNVCNPRIGIRLSKLTRFAAKMTTKQPIVRSADPFYPEIHETNALEPDWFHGDNLESTQLRKPHNHNLKRYMR